MATAYPFSVSKAAKNIEITVRLTGLRRLRIRMAIGVFLFKLGAKIIGCNVRIEDE